MTHHWKNSIIYRSKINMKIIKTAFIIVIAGLLAGGTFLLETRLEKANAQSEPVDIEVIGKGDQKVTQQGGFYTIESSGKSGVNLLFFGNSVLRMAQSGKLTTKTDKQDIVLNLEEGKFWLNSLNSQSGATVNTKLAAVKMDPGVFDVSYKDSVLSVGAYRRSARVEFLGNSLVVPEGRFIEIDETKLESQKDPIAKLRYSKLSKEFSFAALAEADDWVKRNIAEDEKFNGDYRKNVLDEIRIRGPKLSPDKDSLMFTLEDMAEEAVIALTFNSKEKIKKETRFLANFLDAAIYWFAMGKPEQGENFMREFKARMQQASGSENLAEVFSARAQKIAFSGVDEPLFEVKLFLRRDKNPVNAIHAELNDVLDLAANGSDKENKLKIETALRKFGAAASDKLAGLKDRAQAQALFFERVRLADFLDRNRYLLKEEFLRLIALFEKTYLSFAAGKEDSEDKRQFLVNEKLRAIQVLRASMGEGVLSFQDARKAILFAANQIEELKPTFSDTAVSAYYDEQLKELGQFFAFLRSSEASSLRGSYEENFSDFKGRMNDLRAVNEILLNSQGGERISSLRREELAKVVLNDLRKVGLSGVKLALPDAEEGVSVKITESAFEDVQFSARYDTDKKVFSDIVFDGQQIPNSIKLDNLQKFFLLKMGKLVFETDITPESLVEPDASKKLSVVERVALDKLFVAFKDIGVDVEQKNVGLEDFGQGIIHIKLGMLGPGSAATAFSFDVENKTSTVLNLKVQTVMGENTVNDSFPLQELATRVSQIYKQAEFEKQRQEELKKVLQENALEQVEKILAGMGVGTETAVQNGTTTE